MQQNEILLRGVLVTEPQTYGRLRGGPLAWRPRVLEAARRAVSFCLSCLAHLIVALLLLDIIVRTLPEAGGGTVEIGLSAAPGLPEPPTGPAEKARAEAAAPQLPPAVQEPTPPETIGAAAPPAEPPKKPVEKPPAPPSPALPAAAPMSDAPGALYGNRGSSREGAVARFGGTKESEAAVELALEWLARHQERDGSWRFGVGRASCPADSDCRRRIPENGVPAWDAHIANQEGVLSSGLTAMAVLAFLGAGYTHREGAHADTVRRGMQYVLDHQSRAGAFGSDTGWTIMYEQGVAALMLAEAYGLTRDEKLRDPIQRAIRYITRAQTRDGGWMYGPGGNGWELTQSVWQVFALASARKQRFEVPMETLSRAGRMLRDATEEDGWVNYSSGMRRPKRNPTLGSLGAGTFARMVIGVPSDERFDAGVRAMIDEPHEPRDMRSEGPLYFWYYKTLALFQLQNDAWRKWNERIREALIERQVKDGHGSGCWVLRDLLIGEGRDRATAFEARVYVTALATLTLEVYYRYLPFYRSTGSPELDLDAVDPEKAPPKPKPDVSERLRSESSYERWNAAKEAADRKMKELAREVLAAAAREETDIAGSILECVGRLGEIAVAGEVMLYLSDTRARVRAGAHDALKRLTGQDFGEDYAAWQAWWKERKD